MKLRLPYKVEYQDVDNSRQLKPYILEQYLLNAAGKAADRLKIGYNELLNRQMAWVLIRMAIRMQEMPTVGDQLIIETWITEFAHSLSPRHFRIIKQQDGTEKEIGQAASVWAIINLQTRQLQNIFDEECFQSIETFPPLPISFERIRRVPNEGATFTHTISYSDLDYNNHCNSCKYLEMMLNADPSLLLKYGESQHYLFIDLNYAHEMTFSEKATIKIADVEPNAKVYVVQNEAGEVAVSAKVQYLDPELNSWLDELITSDEKKKLDPNNIRKRPQELECDVVRFQNNKDKWIAFVGLLDGRPYEIFTGLADDEDGILLPKSVSKGKIIKTALADGSKRYDFQYVNTRGFKTTVEGLSFKFDKEYWNYAKLISGVLRYGMPLDQVVKMINGLQMDSESINSWKVGVERALKKYIQEPNEQ